MLKRKVSSSPREDPSSLTVSSIDNKSPSKNAFQLMMNARKVSLGTNPQGIIQEQQQQQYDESGHIILQDNKNHIKTVLTQWNNKKGANDKLQAEERREKFVKKTLEKRAKHFKAILQNSTKPSPPEGSSTRTVKKRKKLIILQDSGSDEDFVLDQITDDSESKEFLQMLSPSMKKSESVLSYFDRVPQSSENTSEVSSPVIKVKIVRKSKKKAKLEKPDKELSTEPSTSSAVVLDDETIEIVDVPDSISEIKENEKTDKVEEIQSSRRSSRLAKKTIVSNIEIISDASSDGSECSIKKKIKISQKRLSSKINKDKASETNKKSLPSKNIEKSNIKLAPLFVKKKSIDPIVAEAKHNFLHSGVPLFLKKQLENSIIAEKTLSVEVESFPQTVHVQQKSDFESNFNVWNLPCDNSYRDFEEDLILSHDDLTNNFIFVPTDFKPVENWTDELSAELNISVKEGLRNIKSKYPKFPANKVYKSLKRKSTNRVDCEMTDSEDFHSLPTWVEKYKPTSSQDIIGNFKSVQSIKKWLEMWIEYSESKKKFAKNRRYSDDSLCDFHSSDSESQDSTKVPSKVLVVIGPSSSGKTSSIYAIANELNVEILEANVSSKRSSKKINELGGLNSVNIVKSGNNSFFSSTKHNNGSQEDSSKKKMILMLIDDADLVFDEDEGFASALNSLIQSANRPLLIVASDHNCNHLQQFMKEKNVLLFKPLLGDLLGPWLDILLYVELGRVTPSFCKHLLDSNKSDIRSTILQLQFYIEGSKTRLCSDETIINLNSESDRESICSEDDCDSQISSMTNQSVSLINKIYNQSEYIDNLEKLFWKLNCSLNQKVEKSCIHELSAVCDTLSSLDLMQSYGNECVIDKRKILKLPWDCKIMDSLSLEANNLQYKHHEKYSSESSDYTIDKLDKKISQFTDIQFLDTKVYKLWKTKKRGSDYFKVIYNEFCEGIHPTCLLNRRSLALDYMSTFRNIYETEKKRSTNTFKRNNRFYNYLNNLGIEMKDVAFVQGYKYFEFD